MSKPANIDERKQLDANGHPSTRLGAPGKRELLIGPAAVLEHLKQRPLRIGT